MDCDDNSLRLHGATGIQWKLTVDTAAFKASRAHPLLSTCITCVLCLKGTCYGHSYMY